MINKSVSITPSAIIETAQSWVGTPYCHQASTKNHGADCLGLIRGVYRELYGHEPDTVPAYTPDWDVEDKKEILLLAAKRHLIARNSLEAVAGAVLLFRMTPGGSAKHLGISTDTDRFIHAYAGQRVCLTWLSRWWQARLVHVFEFPGVNR